VDLSDYGVATFRTSLVTIQGEATGLAIWEAAYALADYLVAYPGE
jgi:hypothetical protein